jgi:hypothetical protein
MSCSEHDQMAVGSSLDNSDGHSKIGSGRWAGALGGTRTPNLLIRSDLRR